MEQDIYLYPGSQSEAHRLGEAALWDASFHANVSCARDIEAVIRVYGDGRSALKPEASQMVLKRWGFKRTNFVLANTIERLGPYRCGLWALGSSPRAPKDANQPNELTQI